jgi:glyoxylase-like metal-dependent hydrolase (beta-lactamase superfamily II)
MPDAPVSRTARVEILLVGSGGPSVASTCSLVRDRDVVLVIDPGLSPSQAAILDPLRRLGVEPADVTDVVLSHHHPDHTLNVALFPRALVHDHWAVYDFNGRWDDVDAEGRELTPSIRLIRTPGHTAEDISTVVGTSDGIVVFTHLWWRATIPLEDPYAVDHALFHASRERVLAIADRIVPGHGEPFAPDASTPR